MNAVRGAGVEAVLPQASAAAVAAVELLGVAAVGPSDPATTRAVLAMDGLRSRELTRDGGKMGEELEGKWKLALF
jgi:hypothetical protein